ncbi:MAG: MFS transporter [Pseudomonadota bacterium]
MSSPQTEDGADLGRDTARAPLGVRYRWYVLGILTIVYALNFVDRQIIAVLSPAIQADLGLSDTVLGFLKGPAFALLYTTLGLPIAWLADRSNRVAIVSTALAFWSAFTALSGLAANVVQLSLARVGVGIGEAGCTPPAHSLISDYFPKEERARAMAIYALGIPFGGMLAFLAGSWLLEAFGWRIAFLFVGLPGVLFALVVRLTVREPSRGGFEPSAPISKHVAAKSADPSLSDGVPQSHRLRGVVADVRTLFSIPSYAGVTVAVTFASFTGYGSSFWTIDYYVRAFDVTPADIAIALALLNGGVYGAGTYLGGALADRFLSKTKGAYALVSAAGLSLTIFSGLLSVWAPSAFWALFWSAPFLLGLGLYLGPCFSLVQTLAPVRLRAFATAVFFFVINLIALSGAPLWVGAASDALQETFGSVTALRLALSSLALTSLASVAAFLWTARKLPADWAATEV